MVKGPVMCDHVREGTFYGGYIGNLIKSGSSEVGSFDKREAIKKDVMPAIMDRLDDILKAQEVNGNTFAAGTQPVLIPVYVDPVIIDLVRRETPLLELTQKRAIRGKSFDYNQITVLGAAQWLPEKSALGEADDTYVRKTVPTKYCYSIGVVTGPFIAAARGYMDGMANEVQRKSLALAMELENTLINGDVSANANRFDGLIVSLTTNTMDKSGALLTINDLRTLIRYCKYAGTTPSTTLGGATPNLMVTDHETYDNIKALIQDWLKYPTPGIEVAFGIQAIEFEGVPIIASRYMPTGGSAKRLLVLNTAYMFLGVLQDMTYEEKPSDIDGRKFAIKWYGALAVQAEQFMSQAYGIL